MRFFTLLFLLLAGQQLVSAQDGAPFAVKFDQYRPSNDSIPLAGNQVLIKKVLNTQFTNLVTGQTKNSIGNFASLDITDPAVSFAGNLLFNNGSALAIKATGGISDGFFSIFDHSKLNTNVSLDVQYNFLSLGKQLLATNIDSEDVYNQSIDKIEYDYRTKRMTILLGHDSLELEKRLAKVKSEIAAVETALNSSHPSPVQDSLRFEWGKKTLLRDSIRHALSPFPARITLLHQLHDKTVQQLEALSLNAAIEGFGFGWFSIGYKVTKNAFSYLDPTLPFATQVADTNFVSHEARWQYSYYKWVPHAYRSYFWDAGLAFSYTDNFTSLKKTELSETAEYGPTPGTRTKTKKYNAYQGSYQKDIKGLSIFSDVYYFLFNNNVGAVHLNPSWVIQSKEKPVGNLYVGFLMAFKSGKTDNPIVNAELYYKFLDVFKTTDVDYKLFERNNIGIRFTFPLQFRYNLN